MQILNQTRFKHQFTMGMDKSGREYLSLVIKGTFDFPSDRESVPQISAEQRDLVMADEATGTPGYSATLWESDFAFRKTRCDVVLQGAAYAPAGQPADRVRVGVRIGNWIKQFDVVGQREWVVLGPAITATRPYAFTRQPFSYDTAFGGPDASVPDDPAPPVYRANPVGTGYATLRPTGRIAGIPLPNTESPDDPVTSPFGTYRPMAFGPVSRSVPERLQFAGTYDDNWKDNVFPFLPVDFDDRYYQMAPADQQIDFPVAGTPVLLGNLTARGREEFRLPDTALPIRVERGRETCFHASVLPDTMIFDPEAAVFMLVWRIWVPMRKLITEFSRAWIGKPTRGMLLAEAHGKSYVGAFGSGRRGPEPVQ